MVAHALMRKGMPQGQAIPTAVNRVKRWAAGLDNVRPQVQAAAKAAIAEWNAKKGVSLSVDQLAGIDLANEDGLLEALHMALTVDLAADGADVIDLAPGDYQPPYDWKHGYIPLTPAAAAVKAGKGPNAGKGRAKPPKGKRITAGKVKKTAAKQAKDTSSREAVAAATRESARTLGERTAADTAARRDAQRKMMVAKKAQTGQTGGMNPTEKTNAATNRSLERAEARRRQQAERQEAAAQRRKAAKPAARDEGDLIAQKQDDELAKRRAAKIRAADLAEKTPDGRTIALTEQQRARMGGGVPTARPAGVPRGSDVHVSRMTGSELRREAVARELVGEERSMQKSDADLRRMLKADNASPGKSQAPPPTRKAPSVEEAREADNKLRASNHRIGSEAFPGWDGDISSDGRWELVRDGNKWHVNARTARNDHGYAARSLSKKAAKAWVEDRYEGNPQARIGADKPGDQGRTAIGKSRPKNVPTEAEKSTAQAKADAFSQSTLAKVTDEGLAKNIAKYRRAAPNSDTLKALEAEQDRRNRVEKARGNVTTMPAPTSSPEVQQAAVKTPGMDAATMRRMSDDQLEKAMERLMAGGKFDSPAFKLVEAELDRRDKENRKPSLKVVPPGKAPRR
jgi:hypothetical protein